MNNKKRSKQPTDEIRKPRFIISGGGTGGHIFPAISIANALKQKNPEAEILFVGAENRMEMERVPAAGYPIIGLPVSGFDRQHLLRNIRTLFLLFKSMRKARKLIRDFKPNVAVGVGGYASGPLLRAAVAKKIPCLIQEQNSYAGVTNKLLAAGVARICVAYDGMERFFPKEKILLTGNPVRQDLLHSLNQKEAALKYFGLKPDRPVLLVLGGSLGARSINLAVQQQLELIIKSGVQLIWQTGKYYYKDIMAANAELGNNAILITDFISRMDYAYALADLIVSRAGAGSISEFALLGKAVLLVPSPNVAEDHQTQNALALVRKGAAVMIRDDEAREKLIPEALALLEEPEQLKVLKSAMAELALPNAAEHIADEIIKLAKI
ncbi:MAG: undecaprenyldiphospho-muramoylpentapeptide beta-N-acetylglucosaminyltransferase [Bacteroidales bacterium]|nr:undecaprenyldiphospho-muramoylpentapeptide beta-N-acetylglucosaminyltransferase [Bacteroidales bacterium]MDD3430956.1 undecaprenyldiphospho-muramoylpentapeptide beta-N-acetylglucosaminyltransferase [Bacteroidales bacterium]MDD4361520.1 undecaprenyldiphospho-muramoylpentapeptide beta-N-acetylglucosaminyltransferase [Bacteroidales bacterium]MDD4429898.1 undecaprenyldiphospho-muramoylpentapeptide beta-N-acetylglucosaminyltransferase [Bacteroidales bacterium]